MASLLSCAVVNCFETAICCSDCRYTNPNDCFRYCLNKIGFSSLICSCAREIFVLRRFFCGANLLKIGRKMIARKRKTETRKIFVADVCRRHLRVYWGFAIEIWCISKKNIQ